MKFVLQWIDMAWLALAFCTARQDQRPWVVAFFIGSMVMMRLLVELMGSIHHPDGIMGLLHTPVHTRGLIVYSLAYMAYIAFIRYAPNARGTLLMASSIAFFFAAFFITAIAMVF